MGPVGGGGAAGGGAAGRLSFFRTATVYIPEVGGGGNGDRMASKRGYFCSRVDKSNGQGGLWVWLTCKCDQHSYDRGTAVLIAAMIGAIALICIAVGWYGHQYHLENSYTPTECARAMSAHYTAYVEKLSGDIPPEAAVRMWMASSGWPDAPPVLKECVRIIDPDTGRTVKSPGSAMRTGGGDDGF